MLKLTTDKHEASRGLSATAELLVNIDWRHRLPLADDVARCIGDILWWCDVGIEKLE